MKIFSFSIAPYSYDSSFLPWVVDEPIIDWKLFLIDSNIGLRLFLRFVVYSELLADSISLPRPREFLLGAAS